MKKKNQLKLIYQIYQEQEKYNRGIIDDTLTNI